MLCDGEPVSRYPVMLMRGHGMVVTAERIEMVVLRCIYMAQTAECYGVGRRGQISCLLRGMRTTGQGKDRVLLDPSLS
jgi:hypothetical protein